MGIEQIKQLNTRIQMMGFWGHQQLVPHFDQARSINLKQMCIIASFKNADLKAGNQLIESAGMFKCILLAKSIKKFNFFQNTQISVFPKSWNLGVSE